MRPLPAAPAGSSPPPPPPTAAAAAVPPLPNAEGVPRLMAYVRVPGTQQLQPQPAPHLLLQQRQGLLRSPQLLGGGAGVGPGTGVGTAGRGFSPRGFPMVSEGVSGGWMEVTVGAHMLPGC
jgi:hypothetical protein